jgi:Cu/Ag efflux protein CusF
MTPLRPALSLLLAGLLATSLVALPGCGSDEPSGDRVERTTYTDVRGRFMGTATGGRDIVVHHEPIPDLMGAMVMTIPMADTSELAPIEKDAAIEFDLVLEGANLRVENVEALPDTVTLNLNGDADTTDAG